MTEKTKKPSKIQLELEGRLLRVCEKVVVVFQHEIGQKRGGTQAEKNIPKLVTVHLIQA